MKDPDEYWKKKEEQRRKNESRADAAAGCLDNDFGCGIAAVVIFAIVIAAGNFIYRKVTRSASLCIKSVV